MIREVEWDDIETLRVNRNKWFELGIFRQNKLITESEQERWFLDVLYPGFIINDRAYGKIYSSGEVSFLGFDQWLPEDLGLLIKHGRQNHAVLSGECYLNNPFLTFWLDAGFKVVGNKKNRKYWNGRMWDSLLLEYR